DPAHSTHYAWSDAGRRIRDTDPTGAITEYMYFANGRLRSVTRYDPSARTISFDYEASGSVSRISDPRGHSAIIMYDEAGRVYEALRDAVGNPTIRFVRDAAG